jgi:uncharacterized damage-inducible protein DinB
VTAMDSPEKILAFYDENMPKLLDKLKLLDGEHLSKSMKFFQWENPAVVYLQFSQKHTVHHRGQLSAYLRPMGAKVPGIYGGSADEPMQTSAEA